MTVTGSIGDAGTGPDPADRVKDRPSAAVQHADRRSRAGDSRRDSSPAQVDDTGRSATTGMLAGPPVGGARRESASAALAAASDSPSKPARQARADATGQTKTAARVVR